MNKKIIIYSILAIVFIFLMVLIFTKPFEDKTEPSSTTWHYIEPTSTIETTTSIEETTSMETTTHEEETNYIPPTTTIPEGDNPDTRASIAAGITEPLWDSLYMQNGERNIANYDFNIEYILRKFFYIGNGRSVDTFKEFYMSDTAKEKKYYIEEKYIDELLSYKEINTYMYISWIYRTQGYKDKDGNLFPIVDNWEDFQKYFIFDDRYYSTQGMIVVTRDNQVAFAGVKNTLVEIKDNKIFKTTIDDPKWKGIIKEFRIGFIDK